MKTLERLIFRVGQKVKWSSRVHRFTGTVVAVVPAGESPGPIADLLGFPDQKFGGPRGQESYLVETEGRLYWPWAWKLEKV